MIGFTPSLPHRAHLGAETARPSWITALAVQVVVTSLLTVMSLALLLFGVKVVSNPLFWAATPVMHVPELLFIGIMAVAAVSALLLLPALLLSAARGTLNTAQVSRQMSWVTLAYAAAFMQVAFALVFSAINCG